MSDRPIRLAFPLIGRGHWTGGFVYLKNTLQVVRSRLAGELEAGVLLSPSEHDQFGRELSPLVDGRIWVAPGLNQAGRGRSLAQALLAGKDAALARVLEDAEVDAVFEVGRFYGARLGIPVIAWLPDLQHRHMPQMFTRGNWWRRELGFRMQLRSGRTLMVSSQTAREDVQRFYGVAPGQVHVVRFAINLDVGAHIGRGGEMREAYRLPERFLYLPNQFWRHKNHAVIVRALARLKGEGALEAVPPVVLSGLNEDERNPGHFDGLMGAARAAGVQEHFRYLGLIPYDHVLKLAASCDALLNPSLFEGWSTPIEEAKALGAPLLLSDIPIHREQAPHARFFDPLSVDSAAQALLEISRGPSSARAPLDRLIADQNRRLEAHAASLLGVVDALAPKGARRVPLRA